jgi:hypothetical protein
MLSEKFLVLVEGEDIWSSGKRGRNGDGVWKYVAPEAVHAPI